MGNHEADEGDGTDGGRRGPAQERDGDQGEPAHAGGTDAQRPGLLLPQRQGVECQARGQRQQQTRGEEGPEPGEQTRIAVLQGAHHPEAVGLEGLGVVHGDGAGDGVKAGPQGHARQHEASRTGVGAATGHELNQDGGQGGAGEGEPEVAVDVGDPQQGDGQDHCQGGAGVDAQDAGLGQRVAGQGLHDDPGHGQASADDDGQNGARHAQSPHDDGVDGLVMADQTGPGLTEGQAARADGEAEQTQQPHQGQADQERAACSRPGPGLAEGGTSAAHRRGRHCGPTTVSGSTAGMLPLGASKAIWTTSVSFLPDGP